MNAKTLQNMQHFVGRVCSIVSTAMNRSFNESISREHFVIRVKEITLDGIWGTHPYNEEMLSFFTMQHIISIHEEVELNPNNPEHAEMISEYEQKSGNKVKPDVGKLPTVPKAEVKSILPVLSESPALAFDDTSAGDSTFIDIESIENLAAITKRSLNAYSLLGKDQSLTGRK